MITELQDIADYITSNEQILRVLPYKIKINIKNIHNGRACYKTGYISIPRWAMREGIEYAYYYTIHEVCHCITMSGHDSRFKRYEQKWLKEFGLTPIYKKAYTKALISANGQTLWKQ